MEAVGLNEVCRACLCTGRNMCSLLESIAPKFDSPPNYVLDLWKIFTKMLTVDEYRCRDNICMKCLDEIQRMYAFILKCERSRDVLTKTKPPDKIYLKRLKKITPLRKPSSLNNIKSENEILPILSQIKTEKIEWNGGASVDDEEDIYMREFEEIIHKNDRPVDSAQTPDTLMTKIENDLGTELLDRIDYESHVRSDEVSAIQNIKQEPELDICAESHKFNEIESEDESTLEIAKCPACHFECNFREVLEKHIIEKHMEERVCKICNEEFKCRAIVHCSKHLHVNSTETVRESTNIKRHKCEVCAKKFRWESKLKRHLIIHTGERPFQCEICLKTFRQNIRLTDHLKCHTGVRPFKCEICPKTFIYKTNLTLHLRCHTGERPFKCDYCQRSFIQRGDLTIHLKYHTGERPFQCDKCSKTFVLKRNLTRHLKCHMEDRPHKCEICQKTFAEKSRLTYHFRCHIQTQRVTGLTLGPRRKNHVGTPNKASLLFPLF